MGLLETLIVICFILWLLGALTSHAFGGLLHVLLVVMIVLIIARLLQGKNVV